MQKNNLCVCVYKLIEIKIKIKKTKEKEKGRLVKILYYCSTCSFLFIFLSGFLLSFVSSKILIYNTKLKNKIKR